MKVAAHPMVVAVAFGFLSPSALAEETNEPAVENCVDCGESSAVAMYESSSIADAPTADDIARVQAEWVEVRELIGGHEAIGGGARVNMRRDDQARAQHVQIRRLVVSGIGEQELRRNRTDRESCLR